MKKIWWGWSVTWCLDRLDPAMTAELGLMNIGDATGVAASELLFL